MRICKQTKVSFKIFIQVHTLVYTVYFLNTFRFIATFPRDFHILQTAMSTSTRKSRSRSIESKRGKTSHIVRGMAFTLLLQLYVAARYCFDALIDFLFALYWDTRRQAVPDLDDKYSFLAESATSLAKKIRSQQLTSEQLVSACIERIKAVNPIINAVTDERFESALEEAREVDRLIREGISVEELKNKPFLGVPFTAKESHACAGMLHTWGLRCRRHLHAREDAECVRLMKRTGAILLAVSNVPEINKWQETRNLVFGQTNNPYHSGRTVGGSSGGEGALVASLASPIGLCSDIGGSTRMPAFYNGLFALNPTAGITNMRGSTNRTGLEKDSMVSAGVVSRHACDLAPLTAALAGERAPLLRLDRAVAPRDLRFYYTESSGDLRCSSVGGELRRATKRVLRSLSKETGSDMSPYYHPGLDHMYSLWRYWMSREEESFPRLLTNNEGVASGPVELVKKIFGASQYTLAAIIKLWDEQVLPQVDPKWAEKLTEELKKDLLEKLGDNGVLIFPSCCQPAPYHYTAYLRPFNFAYWGIFNVLKFPAAQVPLGLSEQGLPLGVQVVAAPHQEALCLAVAALLEREFGGFVPPCRVPAPPAPPARAE